MKAPRQKTMLCTDFPLNVFFTDVTEFPANWQEVVEVVYVLDGSLRVGINSEQYTCFRKNSWSSTLGCFARINSN